MKVVSSQRWQFCCNSGKEKALIDSNIELYRLETKSVIAGRFIKILTLLRWTFSGKLTDNERGGQKDPPP